MSLELHLAAADWLHLFTHFVSLSLLSVGGAIVTAPDLHRYLVSQQQWLTDPQFTSAIAIAQAAPGPNVMFVGLLGWNLGLNAGGWPTAVFAVLLVMVAILLPSSVLTYNATQWAYRNRDLRAVRAFKQGMAPIVVALLISTGWVLSAAHPNPATDWKLWLLTVVCALVVWRTRLHLLWLLGAGGLLGALGWV